MSTMECIKKLTLNANNKTFAGRLHKLTKIVKPVLKFLTKKPKTNIITPSTCNYDVIESVQNDINESEPFQLHFKFYDETADNLANEAAEIDENARNEALEARLRESVAEKSKESVGVQTIVNGNVVVEPIVYGTYFAVPVHFVESVQGEFTWVPLADSDVCQHGYESPISEMQKPEQQVPVCVSAA